MYNKDDMGDRQVYLRPTLASVNLVAVSEAARSGLSKAQSAAHFTTGPKGNQITVGMLRPSYPTTVSKSSQ